MRQRVDFMPNGPQTPAGLLSFRSKTPVKVFRKWVALALAGTHLFMSVPAHAADPRKMLKMSRDFFAAHAEERESRRSSEQFANAEAAKLSLVEQKNMVQELVSSQGAGKKGDGSSDPPIDSSPHSNIDNLNQLPPVSVDPRPDIQGDAFSAILASNFQVQEASHSFVENLKNYASALFRGAAQQLFGYITSAFYDGTFGAAASYGLITGNAGSYISVRLGQYLVMYELAMQAEQAYRSLAAYLNQNSGDGFFDNFSPRVLLETSALISTAQSLVNSSTTVTDYIAERASGGPYYPYGYYTYVKIRSQRAVSALSSIYDAQAAFQGPQNRSYDPYASLFGSFQGYTNETYMQDIAAATQGTYTAAQSFAPGFERYYQSEQKAEDQALYKADLKSYGRALDGVADSYRSALNAIGTFYVDEVFHTAAGDGTVYFNVNEQRSVFTDLQGNSYTENNQGEFVSFDLLAGSSSLVQAVLKDRKFWTEKQGAKFIVLDNNRADYSVLTKTYPYLKAVKVVGTGLDTYWEIFDIPSEKFLMAVHVQGSDLLEENMNTMGFGEPVTVREHYELGKLVLVEIRRDLDGAVLYIKKRDGADQIQYDLRTGVVADGIETNSLADDPNEGFRITMKQGIIDQVELRDDSLFGQINEIQGLRLIIDAIIKAKNLEQMIKDAEKQFGGLFGPNDFRAFRDNIFVHAPSASVSGYFSTYDFAQLVNTGEFIVKTRSQSGSYYFDPGGTASLSDKYTKAAIYFSPNRISNDGNEALIRMVGDLLFDPFVVSSPETDFLLKQDYGIYTKLSGKLDDFVREKGDLQGGIVSRILDAKDKVGNLTTKVFREVGLDGRKWIGLRTELISKGKVSFTIQETKFQMIENERDAIGVPDGNNIYLLGKLLTGIFNGAEKFALSIPQITSLQSFLAATVMKSMNTWAEGAASAGEQVQGLFDEFNSYYGPRLETIFHNLLHSSPIISHRIEMNTAGAGAIALKLLDIWINRPYNASSAPLAWTSNFLSQNLSDYRYR